MIDIAFGVNDLIKEKRYDYEIDEVR